MTHNGLHITQVAAVVVPVKDQDAALGFYVGMLGMRKVSDFTYPTGDPRARGRRGGGRSRRRRAPAHGLSSVRPAQGTRVLSSRRG